MKILFVIDTLETGGAERSLLEITQRFKIYEPIFVQLFKGDTLKGGFEAAGIRVISLNLPVTFNIKKISNHIIPIVNDIKPVLIHSTLFFSDLSARFVKKKYDFILVNSFVNNSYSKRRYEEMRLHMKFKLFVIQQWDRVTSKHVDLFISNSQSIKKSNSDALGISPGKIKVIFRGRDYTAYNNLSANEIIILRKNFGFGDEKIFLNVSRLLERKGQRELLHAFKNVLSKFPDAKLLIVGEGPFRKSLEYEISSLQLSNNAFLLGNRDDVPVLLQIASFFIFPSHFEGLPGALIEAMMSKIPIVASNIDENRECVDENSAVLFEVQNISDLTNKMLEIATQINNSDRIQSAYNFALKNFDINNVAMEYENTYDHLLKLKS